MDRNHEDSPGTYWEVPEPWLGSRESSTDSSRETGSWQILMRFSSVFWFCSPPHPPLNSTLNFFLTLCFFFFFPSVWCQQLYLSTHSFRPIALTQPSSQIFS